MNTARRILNAPFLKSLDVVSLTREYTDLVDEDGAKSLRADFFAITGTRHLGRGEYEFRVAPVDLSEGSALIRWGEERIVYGDDFERRFTSERAA